MMSQKKKKRGGGKKKSAEMAQWSRAPAGLAEDPGSVPSTYMVAYSQPPLQFYGIQCPPLAYRSILKLIWQQPLFCFYCWVVFEPTNAPQFLALHTWTLSSSPVLSDTNTHAFVLPVGHACKDAGGINS